MKKGFIMCLLLIFVRCDTATSNSRNYDMYLTFLHEEITIRLTDKEIYAYLKRSMPKTITLHDNDHDQKYSLQLEKPLSSYLTTTPRMINAYDVILTAEGKLSFYYEDAFLQTNIYFIGQIIEGFDSLTYMDEDMIVNVSFSD